jgi:membrane fusion protein, multidrug efflux system
MTRSDLAIVVLLVSAGCSHKAVEEVETTAAAPVKTLTLAPKTVEGVVSASGVVSAAPGADWTITAPEPARIVELPKAEGDRVKPGDLLVRFEIPSLSTDVATRKAEAETAGARVDNAQANVTRLTTLVAHGVAAQKELEDARRELAEARAALAQADSASRNAGLLASRTVVRARFAGVIARRAHNPGDMVEASASDVILRVIDPSRLQVVASVAIADVRRVEIGRPVRIFVPGSDAPEMGKVLTRPAAVDPAGVTADVRVSFAGAARLPAGTPVRVEIIAEQRPNALAVPAQALLHEDEDTFVMVAGADHKAHKRKVELGLTTPTEAEITSGLKAGDAVVVQGQQGLPDGAAITLTQ